MISVEVGLLLWKELEMSLINWRMWLIHSGNLIQVHKPFMEVADGSYFAL